MNYMITTLLPRGQVTIPKKLREIYGFVPGPVMVVDGGDGVSIKPWIEGRRVRPKISKTEHLRRLKRHTGVYWTKADDEALKALEVKEKKWDW